MLREGWRAWCVVGDAHTAAARCAGYGVAAKVVRGLYVCVAQIILATVYEKSRGIGQILS